MKKHTDVTDTVGYIDRVVPESDAILVEGWVAAVAAAPVDELSICIGGRAPARYDSECGMASPDVREIHPLLLGSGDARFRIQVPLEADRNSRVGDALVEVTPWIRGSAGRVLYHVLDPCLPKPSDEYIDFVGGGFNVGFEFLGHLIERAGLGRTDHVLDVGCGTGRMAYALAYYLEPSARYAGFDVAQKLIRWAQGAITPSRPNFVFSHADIYNGKYNPTGTVRGEDFVFPYEDGCFDLTFLTSVFTHMRGGEVRHYLEEIRRVLRPGGCCFVTCFLLDQESKRLQAAGTSPVIFAHELEDCFTTSPAEPEAAIAFQEERLLKWIADRGFELRAKHPGWWSGRSQYASASYQDILILRRL